MGNLLIVRRLLGRRSLEYPVANTMVATEVVESAMLRIWNQHHEIAHLSDR